MSVSLTRPETYDCARDECENTRNEVTSVGSYCSEQCSQLAAGEELLRHIRQDHRLCSGCFRQLKEIERPPVEKRVNIGPVDHEALAPTWKNCLVGYQYITKHAELGQRSYRRGEARRENEIVDPADEHTLSGVVCTCGTTDHRDSYVRDERMESIRTVAGRLCDLLELLGREGQHDKTVNATTLVRTVEQFEEPGTEGWQLAVGRAIESSAEDPRS